MDETMLAKIREQDEIGGIYVSKLPAACYLVVHTKNSIYTMTPVGVRRVLLHGGPVCPDPTEVIFNGSTWGGSILKIDWIGRQMHMEWILGRNRYLSSPVAAAKVVGPGWYYDLEWD